MKQCSNCVFNVNMFVGFCNHPVAYKEKEMNELYKQKCKYFRSKEEFLNNNEVKLFNFRRLYINVS